MRGALAAAAVVVAGCTFDAPPGAPGEPGGDGGGPQSLRCASLGAVSASELRLCLDLEDASPMVLARDASGRGNDALADKVAPIAHGTEQAGAFGDGSRLTVENTTDLDITPAVSIDLYAAVAQPINSGDRYWMLDHGSHYFVNYKDNHEVQCGVEGDQTVDSKRQIDDAQFHHVACTYDGNELRVYIDGDVVNCQNQSTTIDASVHAVTDIGHRSSSTDPTEQFRGALDNIHVFARTLRPDEICALAHRGSGCLSTCPSE